MGPIVTPVLFVVGAVVLAQLINSALYGCELVEDGVAITWWGMSSVWTIDYDEIVRVEIVPLLAGAAHMPVWVVSRAFGPYVLIERRALWRRYVLVTPTDAAAFVACVQERVAGGGDRA